VFFEEVADGHGLDAGGARAALVQRPQERHAAVWVVLPAVFAIKDDADQRRLRAVADRLLDVEQVLDEIVRRRGPLAALIVKPIMSLSAWSRKTMASSLSSSRIL